MKRTWEDRERDRDIYLDERLGGYGVFCIECEYYSHCLKDPDDPQRADFCPKREA